MIRDQDAFSVYLESLRRFVVERLIPCEREVSDSDAIPANVVTEMKSLGLFGLSIPEEHGGLGLTMEEEVLAVLELGRSSPAFRSLFGTAQD